MVFPQNPPSDNQVLMTIIIGTSTYVLLRVCSPPVGRTASLLSQSCSGRGQLYFFTSLFSKLIESGGEGTVKAKFWVWHNHPWWCSSQLTADLPSSWDPVPVVFLQEGGLRVIFEPVRRVQPVKTLVPREWFPFWQQTQGLWADNVAGRYLEAFCFG